LRLALKSTKPKFDEFARWSADLYRFEGDAVAASFFWLIKKDISLFKSLFAILLFVANDTEPRPYR
jgi:hypothetical protein